MLRSLKVASFVLVTLSAAVACSSPEGTAEGSAESHLEQPPAPAAPLPKEIHWFRNSAEVRALTRQVYTMAGHAVDSAAYKGGKWGVVLDVDETVLDNSEFQKESLGKPFDAA